MHWRGKVDLRRAALRRRRERPAEEVAAAGVALVPRVLRVLDEAGAGSGRARPVAAYASIAGEPPTGPLLEALARRGLPVLLPVLLDDGDLDWAAADGSPLVPGRAGTAAPGGRRLGREAVARAAAVVVPGVAGSPRGCRLGRGGGAYDRALARVPSGVPVLLLLFDDEVVDTVPTEPHDRPVTHVVTPSRTLPVAQAITRGLD